MTSDLESERKELSEKQIFVNLLRNAKILFKKDCTPLIKNEKKEALEKITAMYNLETKQQLNTKQMLKKFNNIKTRLKAQQNKRIELKRWENEFMDLWNGSEKNAVLYKNPRAGTADLFQREQNKSEPVESTNSADWDEFGTKNVDDLKKMALIADIKAKRGQEQAALAQERAALAQEKAALAQERAALAQERAALAQERAAIPQPQLAMKMDPE